MSSVLSHLIVGLFCVALGYAWQKRQRRLSNAFTIPPLFSPPPPGASIAQSGERRIKSHEATAGKPSAFTRQAEKVILRHLEDESFGIAELSQALHLSRSQLHRKIKAEVGLSPSLFVRKVRLHKAKRLLASKTGNISEVAFSVGMANLAHFSSSFKAEFGFPPSHLRTRREENLTQGGARGQG